MNKDQRREIAEETVRFIEEGSVPSHKDNFKLHTAQLERDTQYYKLGPLTSETQIEVTDQTTLEAAQELAVNGCVPGVLNFASAKNPGGGFLRGTEAQEESLARASALYASLSSEKAQPYYEAHRDAKSLYYSDRMIFSPQVPIFRDDYGYILDEPYYVHILTAAAPNRRALEEKGKANLVKIVDLIQSRVRKMLHIFEINHTRTLVLGAWGCGVFGNSPQSVARAFALALKPSMQEGAAYFAGRFDRIRFAIPDRGDGNHPTFKAYFKMETDSVVW